MVNVPKDEICVERVSYPVPYLILITVMLGRALQSW